MLTFPKQSGNYSFPVIFLACGQLLISPGPSLYLIAGAIVLQYLPWSDSSVRPHEQWFSHTLGECPLKTCGSEVKSLSRVQLFATPWTV